MRKMPSAVALMIFLLISACAGAQEETKMAGTTRGSVILLRAECSPFLPHTAVKIPHLEDQRAMCTDLSERAIQIGWTWDRVRGAEEAFSLSAYTINDRGEKIPLLGVRNMFRFYRMIKFVLKDEYKTLSPMEVGQCAWMRCMIGEFDIKGKDA